MRSIEEVKLECIEFWSAVVRRRPCFAARAVDFEPRNPYEQFWLMLHDAACVLSRYRENDARTERALEHVAERVLSASVIADVYGLPLEHIVAVCLHAFVERELLRHVLERGHHIS